MESQPPRRPGEVVFILLLLAFSCWALWQSWLIAGFSKLSSPGVFPMLASAVMLISSLFILVESLRKRPLSVTLGTTVLRFTQEILSWRLLVVVLLILLYVLAMPLVGFVLSSSIFLFVSFAYLWRKSVLLSLLLSIISLAVVYAVFRLAFQVVLPKGNLTGLPF